MDLARIRIPIGSRKLCRAICNSKWPRLGKHEASPAEGGSRDKGHLSHLHRQRAAKFTRARETFCRARRASLNARLLRAVGAAAADFLARAL